MTVDLRDIEVLEARPMAHVFPAIKSSERIHRAVLTLRADAAKLQGHLAEQYSIRVVADALEETIGDVALLEATQVDLLDDIKVKREIIRRLGGSSQ